MLRVLFTSVGRRIELLEAFRKAARSLRIGIEVHGADITQLAPAIHRVDKAHRVLRYQDRRHIPELLDLVKRERIDLLVPLRDSDLLAFCGAREKFAACGCTLLISDDNVIRTCADKLLTFQVLKDAGIDTPQTWSAKEALAIKQKKYPYFIKPRAGSAGEGLYQVNSLEELKVFINRSPDCIVQELVEGTEHTLDVYAGLDGVPRCVVPRRRLEVRTGEVSKGIIIKDPAVIEIGKQVARTLGTCRGVVTVQCMVTPQGRIRVIEVNPRFGGGAPLAIEAGADFPRWIMAELLGRNLRVDYQAYRDRLTMLRYDQSVFINGNAVKDDWRESNPTARRS